MMQPKDIIEKWKKAQTERINQNNAWNEVCHYVWPRHAEFITEKNTGEKLTGQYMVGGVTELIDQAVSMIVGLTAPEGEKWHGIITGDPDIDNDDDFQNWGKSVENILFPMRYDAYGNFHEAYKNIVKSNLLFGNATGYPVDPDGDGRLLYQTVPLSRVWITTDSYGRVNGYLFNRRLTGAQIKQEYSNTDDTLSDAINREVDSNPDNKYDIIVCIAKKEKPSLSTDRYKDKTWLSYHVFADKIHTMRTEGFNSNPILFTRTDIAPADTYGTGLIERIMPEIKQYDQAQKSLAKHLPLATLGMMLAKDDYVGFGQKAQPGSMIMGGIDSEGRRALEWIFPQGRVDWAMKYAADVRDNIARRLTIQLLEIIAEKPNMTATEILQRAQERGMMLAPLLSVNMRFLGMQTEREIELLELAGVLPPRPAILINNNKPLRVRFESPASNLMQQQDVRKLSEYAQAVAVVAQVSPETAQGLAAELNPMRLNEYLKDALGIDNTLFYTAEEKQANAEAQQAQQASMMAMQGAPQLAQAQKYLAEADQIRSGL